MTDNTEQDIRDRKEELRLAKYGPMRDTPGERFGGFIMGVLLVALFIVIAAAFATH